MELELTDDQQELQDSVRTVLDAKCPPAVVRSVYESGADAAELWAQMVELYWPAVALPEEVGGLGLTFVELAIVAEELGRATAPGPFLGTATQFAPLVLETGTPDQQQALLTPVAESGSTGTVAFAERGRYELAAVETTARRSGDGWVIDGAKSVVFDGGSADEIAVIARAEGTSGDDGLGVFVVSGADVKAAPRTTMDPTLSLADLSLQGVSVPADRVLVDPADPGGAESIRRAWQSSVIALAWSTVGTCRRIFDITLEYAKVREQYERQIGSFQALKHRFADAYLSVERATSLCYFAALTVAEDDPRRAEAASLAKAAAGDCQRLLVREGLQLHGGVGFTWEYDLHFLLKRAKAGDALLGTADFHRAELARMLGLTAGSSPVGVSA
jgi:alkylation response protein AidB-like acyl-CoA dehydrogenase